MSDFLLQVGALAAALTAIVGFLATVAVFIKKPWRAVRKAFAQLETINTALGPNGGKSLADVIHRTESTTKVLNAEVSRTGARLSAVSDMLERPIFETCEDGEWDRVNRAFELTFGFTQVEAVGRGWINLIQPADRDRVVREWQHAVADQRMFRSECRVLTAKGLALDVSIQAHPIVLLEPERPTIGWFGRVDIVSAKGASS